MRINLPEHDLLPACNAPPGGIEEAECGPCDAGDASSAAPEILRDIAEAMDRIPERLRQTSGRIICAWLARVAVQPFDVPRSKMKAAAPADPPHPELLADLGVALAALTEDIQGCLLWLVHEIRQDIDTQMLGMSPADALAELPLALDKIKGRIRPSEIARFLVERRSNRSPLLALANDDGNSEPATTADAAPARMCDGM